MIKKIGFFHIARKNIRRKFFRSMAIVISVTVVAATLFLSPL